MLIIWGTKVMEKILGNSQKTYQCTHCNNINNYKIFRRRIWFTLFWIPIFPFSSKYYITCPICNYGVQVKKEEALQQVQGMVN